MPQYLLLKNANVLQNKLAVYKSEYTQYGEGNVVSGFNQIEFSYLNGSLDISSNYDQFLKDINLLVEKDMPTKHRSKVESKS